MDSIWGGGGRFNAVSREVVMKLIEYRIGNQLRNQVLQGLPWWSGGQDSVLPLKGPGFHPWSGNQIPHVATKRSCVPQLKILCVTKTNIKREKKLSTSAISYYTGCTGEWERLRTHSGLHSGLVVRFFVEETLFYLPLQCIVSGTQHSVDVCGMN